MKRILIGGSYVGALAAGAVASAQLWMHAFTVDEPSAIRELAVPGSHVRSVPALVAPVRPRVVRPPASPAPFSSFTPVFISTGSPATATVRGPVAVPTPAGGAPVVPAPGTAAPGQPAPGSGGSAGSTPSMPPTASGPAPTASPAPATPPPTSTPG